MKISHFGVAKGFEREGDSVLQRCHHGHVYAVIARKKHMGWGRTLGSIPSQYEEQKFMPVSRWRRCLLLKLFVSLE